ncbi:hypothetical protein BJ138DRAFT_1017035 [Hygrophoropsis aurantiaca]|uniref:Uncharacterized protein n=1 Tax=Hygrophoropsis aurantiaca TaxID=72124 RepID=A0ACB7ZYU9_9AGAM|nr:hypothetical protein BJ138DRAFT_1017035 [Hygrophoropsis aurantiaca]
MSSERETSESNIIREPSTSIHSSNEANSSSWAARNPGQPIILPRTAPPRLDAAQKASRNIASQKQKENADLLHAAVKDALKDFQNKIAEIAILHNVSVEKVQRLIGGYQNYAPSRKPHLANALLHAKAQSVNSSKGEKYTIAEIRELVKEDSEMQNLDPEQAKVYIDELAEHRELQKHGMRANNAAAAKDMYSTLTNVFKALDSLVVRTGGYAIVFATRGHVNDTAMPTWHGTHNSMDFFEDVLKLAPDDVCRKFEQWACTRDENLLERDNLDNVRRTCIRLIKSGLGELLIIQFTMNYDNYETAIMNTLHVKLIGWPADVPFRTPWKIHTVSEMRRLRDALKFGECYWVAMSAREAAEHSKSLTTRRQAGETIGKPRAPRSDRGKKRGKRAPRGNVTAQPSKRARTGNQRKQRANVTTADTTAGDDGNDDYDDDEDEAED